MPLLTRTAVASDPAGSRDDHRRPRRRTALVAAAAGLAVLAVGTPVAYATLGSGASPEPRPAVAGAVRGKDYVETRLLFDTERPDGGPEVTDRHFL